MTVSGGLQHGVLTGDDRFDDYSFNTDDGIGRATTRWAKPSVSQTISFNTDDGIGRATTPTLNSERSSLDSRFNTDDGIGRATTPATNSSLRTNCKVSIPMTVSGGLQRTSLDRLVKITSFNTDDGIGRATTSSVVRKMRSTKEFQYR